MALSNDDVQKDWYAVLGVSSSATQAEIKKAYRKLARDLHPDKNPGDAEAEAQFKDVSRAYDILGDEPKRKEYDETRQLLNSGGFRGGFPGAGSGGPAGSTFTFDLGDLLGGAARAGGGGAGAGAGAPGSVGDLFGGLFGRGRGGTQRTPVRGEDVAAEVTLSFEQSMSGAEVSVRLSGGAPCHTCHGSGAAPGTSPTTCPNCNGRGVVSRNQGGFAFAEPCRECGGSGRIVETPCPTCHGSGTQDKAVRVRVPAGVSDGQTVRVRNRGRAGARGGPAGDLNVTVRVTPHKVFRREGAHLTLELPVTYSEAVLGTTVRVPTLGDPVTLKIAPGTPPGKRLRVKGRGFPNGAKGNGDLLVTVQVTVPQTISAQAREELVAFANDTREYPRQHLEALLPSSTSAAS